VDWWGIWICCGSSARPTAVRHHYSAVARVASPWQGRMGFDHAFRTMASSRIRAIFVVLRDNEYVVLHNVEEAARYLQGTRLLTNLTCCSASLWMIRRESSSDFMTACQLRIGLPAPFNGGSDVASSLIESEASEVAL